MSREGVVEAMTKLKPIVVTAAVLLGGLMIAGAAPAAQEPPRDAADPGPLVLSVEVVDAQGHPLPGVDIGATIGYFRGPGIATTVFERAKSDGQGRARLEVARKRPIGIASYAYIWAHQPGRSIAAASVNLGVQTPPPVRLTLEEPAQWTITALGPDGRPIAGLRIAPCVMRPAARRAAPLPVPDEWVDRLSATTDADGTAKPTWFPPNMQLLAIRIAGPGVAPHALPFTAGPGNATIKLGRPGRLVGIVRTADGRPLPGVAVEVQVQEAGNLPTNLVDSPITSTEPLRLDSGPLRTGPQGEFRTPATLLSGSSYRVSVRHDGYLPFISDWITLDGQRATVPDIRLQPLRTLTGQIRDRQGRSVAGARVFVAGHGPTTATDAEGRFALGGVEPARTVVLAEKAGFRLWGWAVDPSASPQMGSLTLARRSESPEPAIRPMAEAMPLSESRRLAEELLEPLLDDEKNHGNPHLKLAGIAVLAAFDPAAALELLQDGQFPSDRHHAYAHAEIADRLAEKDPARASAFIGTISDPPNKVRSLVNLARGLPAAERDRKNALLEQAADGLKDFQPSVQLQSLLPSIVGQWLDMGERDRARRLLQKGKTFYDAIPAGSQGTQPEFLLQLARLEPDHAMERLRKIPDLTRLSTRLAYDPAAAIAVGLATDHPADAEWALNLWKRSGVQYQTNHYVMRLCDRLARVDPSRAQSGRRGAAGARGTRPGLGLGGPRSGGEGQGRRQRRGRPRDRGARPPARIGPGSRTGPHRRLRPPDVSDEPRRFDPAGRRAQAPDRLDEVFCARWHCTLGSNGTRSSTSSPRSLASSASCSPGTTARSPPRSSRRWPPTCTRSPRARSGGPRLLPSSSWRWGASTLGAPSPW